MINLIPTPKQYTLMEGKTTKLPFCIYTNQNAWKNYCYVFKEMVSCLSEKEIEFAEGGITLICSEEILVDQYVIDIDAGVSVFASNDNGILYGIASLLQLLDFSGDMIVANQLHLSDYPEKSFRGLMVDLARQWHPFSKLKNYIDLCFLYKIKYIHLHFIDSERYTLPSRAFPNLVNPKQCYTYTQIEELNQYAKSRGIVLIPEFECPGHAQIMVKNYPEVFDNEFAEIISSNFCDENGRLIDADHLMCAGKEECIDAVKTLISEICELFPESPYIHIGGDEANIELWNYCDKCTEYMKQNSIQDVHELYSEFVGRVAEYVLSQGRVPMVWEGFPEKGTNRIPKETIVIAWESYYHTPDKLINSGFQIINASWKPLYIVPKLNLRWDAFEVLRWNVYNWQNWWSASKAYLNPINIPPTDRVLGGLLCAWEQTYEREIPFVMEKLAAMSEKTWSVKRICTDEEFLPKLLRLLKIAERVIQDV